MPRAGWVKPETDQRLSDHISIGVLTRVFPPDLVDRVIKENGRTEQRHRLLPARVVAYYVLGLALFSHCAYEEVMRMLVEGLSWQEGWATQWNVPTKAALFKARTRLEADVALPARLQEVLGAPGRVGAHDHCSTHELFVFTGPVSGGDVTGQLSDGGIEHADVVGHRVRPGVAGSKECRKGLAGRVGKENIGWNP